MKSRPPWTTALPTGRACGQPVLCPGTAVAHRSPSWSLRPDALALAKQPFKIEVSKPENRGNAVQLYQPEYSLN